jgi:hypothetical protein
MPLSLAQRISASLLRFRDIKIKWSHDDQDSPVTAAELDALAAIPRLRVLNVHGRWTAGPAQIESLVRRPGLRGLTALTCSGRQLDKAVTESLADHCPRLSTVKIFDSNRSDPPLHRLPALTDLTVRVRHEGGLTMTAVVRCARLRRLTVTAVNSNGFTPRDVHAAMFSPNLRALEHLALPELDARGDDCRYHPVAQLDWGAAFAGLPALRSLQLKSPRGIDELLAAIGAVCVQLHSLTVLSFGEANLFGSLAVGDPLPSATAVGALLARRPSLRSVSLMLPTRERCMGARSSSGDHTGERSRLHAHGDLCVLAALHRQRLSVRFIWN